MTEPVLAFDVLGEPVPQGSKVRSGPGLRDANAKSLTPWRFQVGAAAEAAIAELSTAEGYTPTELPLLLGPVLVRLVFTVRRPKGHFGTGRNARRLKPTAPWYAASRPDLDKLARAVLDALTGIAWRDDGQVSVLIASKVYGPRPALHVAITSLPHAEEAAQQ